jgi:putative flippase GtrA
MVKQTLRSRSVAHRCPEAQDSVSLSPNPFPEATICMRSANRIAPLTRQFAAFSGVGVVAAVVHYGLLIGLVEGGGLDPVPATLTGYVGGGLVSYVLNRRLTYASTRPHAEAGWRFVVVAAVGFLLTGFFMHVFTRRLGAPYLAAQLVTTVIVLFWSFVAHKLWTFER